MKKTLLIAALLPLGCQTQFNPANCVVGLACSSGQRCDPVSETCQPMQLTLTNIEPPSGGQRAATMVTITGTGFQAGISVQVNGVPATQVSLLSPTQLTALVPASAARCGPVNVHLTNPDNTTADRADLFRYLGGGTIRFAAQPATGTTPAPAGADQIIIRDLDNDSYEDLAIKSPSGASITLCAGNAAGVPSCNVTMPYPLSGLTFMRIHDFEHNRKPDIMVVPRLNPTSATAWLARNPGSLSGTWGQTSYNLTTNLTDLVAADRPGGGPTDLFVATTQQLATAPFVLDSSFVGTPVANEALRGLLLAQLDPATEAPELVAGRNSNAGLEVLEAAAPGALYAQKWMSTLQVATFRLADFNNDGKPDLVAVNDTGGSWYLALGQGDGTFASPVQVSVPAVTAPLFEVADLACDGNQQLVVITGKNLSYLALHADATAAAPVPITTGTAAITGVAVKDLNSDGRPDIVYTTATTGVTILSNFTGP